MADVANRLLEGHPVPAGFALLNSLRMAVAKVFGNRLLRKEGDHACVMERLVLVDQALHGAGMVPLLTEEEDLGHRPAEGGEEGDGSVVSPVSSGPPLCSSQIAASENPAGTGWPCWAGAPCVSEELCHHCRVAGHSVVKVGPLRPHERLGHLALERLVLRGESAPCCPGWGAGPRGEPAPPSPRPGPE